MQGTAAVILLLLASGEMLPIDNAKTCLNEAEKINRAAASAAVCIATTKAASDKLLAENRRIIDGRVESYRRDMAELKKRRAQWAKSDRVWCSMIKRGSIDEDDMRHWPDLRACRKDTPRCPFKPAKPAPCPKWFMQ